MTMELKAIDGLTRQIEILRHVADEIRGCRDIEQVKKVADWGQMVKLAARRVGASLEVQNEATEASIKARHWEGTLLREMPKHPPGPDSRDRSHDATDLPPTLSDLGITKSESSRAQAIAEIPEDALVNAIEAAKEAGQELATEDFVALGRAMKNGKEDRGSPDRCRPKEEDKPRRANWEKMMYSHSRIVNSIQKNGGIKALVKGWSMEEKEEFIEQFNHLIEELRVMREDLRKSISTARPE